MMIAGFLFPAAVLVLLVVLAVMFFQRREALDLSPRGLIRSYLYLGSLAGILTLAIGLASLANVGLAAALGTDVVYGDIPFAKMVGPRCPPGSVEKGCVEPTSQQLEDERRRATEQRDHRRSEDLLRGITFTVFGAVIWGAHWGARRGLIPGGEGGSALRRAYLMVGTVIFGVVTIAMLPNGIYQALSRALLPTTEQVFRQPADSLGGGLAALPIWLLYLWQVVRDFRDSPAQR